MADGVDQAKLGAGMARFYNISAPTVSRIRRRAPHRLRLAAGEWQ
jgi:hypothetical protein